MSSPDISPKWSVKTYGRHKPATEVTESPSALQPSHTVLKDIALGDSPLDAPNDDLPVKPPVKTYGRRKPPIHVPEASSSSHGLSHSISSDISFSNPASDASIDAPPSSKPYSSSLDQAIDAEERDSDVEERNDASKEFKWKWKDELKRIDDIGNEEEHVGQPQKGAFQAETSERSRLPDSRPLSAGQSTGDDAFIPTSPSHDTEPSLSQGQGPDLFSGSLSTLTSSTLSISQRTVSPSPSPKTIPKRRLAKPHPAPDSDAETNREDFSVPRLSSRAEHSTDNPASHKRKSPNSVHRRRVGKALRVLDSDAETDEEHSKDSYPSSPAKDTINTPKTRSSPTPPTSDEDYPMPSAKSKASSRRNSVAPVTPLLFEDELDTSMPKSKGKRAASTKIKRPTKKAIQDTILDRHRIAAEKQVSIARSQGSGKLTMKNLLTTVRNSSRKPPPLKGEDSMDPISEFSSPGPRDMVAGPLTLDANARQSVPLPDLDSDEELPDMQSLLQTDKMKDLKEKKQSLLAKQQLHKAANSDDDDDLEIVDGPNTDMQVTIEKEAEARRGGKKNAMTAAKRKVQQLSGVHASRPPPKEIASPSQARNAKELNAVLLQKVHAESARRTKEKSEEWVRRGGKAFEFEAHTAESRGLEWYADQGLKNVRSLFSSKEEEVRGSVSDEDEDEDEDDPEWSPSQRGSASPVPHVVDDELEGQNHEEAFEEAFEEDQDKTMINEEDGAEDEFLPRAGVSFRRPSRIVIHSDSENDENDENAAPRRRPLGNVLVEDSSMVLDDSPEPNSAAPSLEHRGSFSFSDTPTEDEGDKENNDRLMYDRSEDKENTVVVRHGIGSNGNRPTLGQRQSSLFNLEEGLASRLSMSPGDISTDEEREKARSPLKTLRAPEPFSPASIPFAARLQRASSTATIANNNPPSPTLAPLVPRERQASGFSQFSEDGGDSQPKKLAPGFSDIFNSVTQNLPPQSSRPPLGSYKSSGKQANYFGNLRRNDSLGLTQDIGLQPALEVDENLKRQADNIFEKEQEFLLEAANISAEKPPELYINDHGFLTQTRPDDDAEVYRPPPTPSQRISEVQADPFASQRQPFRELSMSSTDFSEDTPAPSNSGRLQRLTKRADRSPSASMFQSNVGERSSAPSLLPSPSDLSKTSRLGDGARVQKQKQKRKLGKSAFVEAEAQESDEDEQFGFKKAKEDEDEDDGDDQDRTLETLVDDKEMGQREIAEDKVLEKYQEHVQADDAAIEELHNAAIRGQMRYGKRSRAGIDDSDDDSEDDEKNRRIRRKMQEPQIRGDIKSLGELQETRAFAEAYQNAINGDKDHELAYLQEEPDSQPMDVAMSGMRYEDNDEDMEDENDENNENSVFVSRDDVIRQLREAAQAGEDEGPALDPNDTSFVDADDDDNDVMPQVRDVSRQHNSRVRGGRKAALDPLDLDGPENYRSNSFMIDEQGRPRAEAFVKAENRTRRMGTARSVGGISVTGHKKLAKAGSGSSRAGNSSMTTKRPVKAAPSMLSRVDRKDRFQ